MNTFTNRFILYVIKMMCIYTVRHHQVDISVAPPGAVVSKRLERTDIPSTFFLASSVLWSCSETWTLVRLWPALFHLYHLLCNILWSRVKPIHHAQEPSCSMLYLLYKYCVMFLLWKWKIYLSLVLSHLSSVLDHHSASFCPLKQKHLQTWHWDSRTPHMGYL